MVILVTQIPLKTLKTFCRIQETRLVQRLDVVKQPTNYQADLESFVRHNQRPIQYHSPLRLACDDDCQSFVPRNDCPRTIQWNMLAFIVDVVPVWRKILKLLWHLQFSQIQHEYRD